MASLTFTSRCPVRSPAPQLEISALADTVRIHQATLNQIPRGTNPSSDWLRTVTTDTAAIAASLREIGPRISPADRSLQRNFQILGLDLECLQDRIGLIVSRVQNVASRPSLSAVLDRASSGASFSSTPSTTPASRPTRPSTPRVVAPHAERSGAPAVHVDETDYWPILQAIANSKETAGSAASDTDTQALANLKTTIKNGLVILRGLKWPSPKKRNEILGLIALTYRAVRNKRDNAHSYNIANKNIAHIIRYSQIIWAKMWAKDSPDSPEKDSAIQALFFLEWQTKAEDLFGFWGSNKGLSGPAWLKDVEILLQSYPQYINAHPGDWPTRSPTILHEVAKSEGQMPIEVVSLLARYGADFTNHEDPYFGNTPAMWAIANANNGMAWEMLQHGPQRPHATYLNHQCKGGNTALHLAIGKGYTGEVSAHGDALLYTNDALAQKIIELGADINIANRELHTPLHLACIQRNLRMMRYLLERGANPTAKNAQGQTPGDLLTISFGEACKILSATVEFFTLDPTAFAANQREALAIYGRFLAAYTSRASSGRALPAPGAPPTLKPALPSSSSSPPSAVGSRPVSTPPSAATPLDRDALILGLLSDPKSVLSYEVSEPMLPCLRGYPAITECQCISGFKREDLRTGIPDCRRRAEDAFVREMQTKFPLPRHREIFVCSIASSCCFQELVIHAKLTALGYKVNWLLVDPIYSSGGEMGTRALADFNHLAKLIDPATTITTLPSIEHLVREGMASSRMPDAFMAIDLDYLGESTVDAYYAKLLPIERLIESLPNPHFYLYADKRPLKINASSIVSDLTGAQPSRPEYSIRPIVTITDIGASGIRKKQVLGAEAWDSTNYRKDNYYD